MYKIISNNKAQPANNGYICSLYGRKFIALFTGGEAAMHETMAAIGYKQAEICRASDIQVKCMQSLGASTYIIKEA